jgi:hypothetical protein
MDAEYAEKEYLFPYGTHARDILLFGLRDFFPVSPLDWDRAPLWLTSNPKYLEVIRAKAAGIWPTKNQEVRSLAE